MITAVTAPDNYQLARKLLDAAALRQEAIATNVANAETPGFRRLDVSADFAQQLRSKMGSGLPGSLEGLQPKLAEDQDARSVRPDGNSVEIEHELLAMNRNSVEYNYLSDIVSTNLKQLRMAITGHTA